MIDKGFYDFRESVSLMSLSMCKNLGLGDMKLTIMSLQLVDQMVKYPLDILEDIQVKVGKFIIPTYFVILDMDEDLRIPIIL